MQFMCAFWISEKYIPDIESKRNTLEDYSPGILLSIGVCCNFAALGYSLHFLGFQTHPLHFYSMITLAWETPPLEPLWKLCYFCFELVSLWHVTSESFLLSTILFTILLQSMPFIMKELHVGVKGYRSKESFRYIQNLFPAYRTCELFVKFLMLIFGHIFISAQSLCGQMGLVTGVVFINMFRSLDIQAMVTLSFICSVIQLQAVCSLYEQCFSSRS